MDTMRRDEKKTKKHEASSSKGALEVSGRVLIPGVKPPAFPPPKIGVVVVDGGTFGLFIGVVVLGVFGPPEALINIIRNQTFNH